MRQQGRLTEWNDDRGFGFVTPLDGGSRLFAHVSQFPSDKRRPMVTDLVTYAYDRDGQGRPCAKELLFMTPTRSVKPPNEPAHRSLRLPRVALVISALILATAVVFGISFGSSPVTGSRPISSPSASADQAIASAFSNQQSGVQVAGEGVVIRVLSDDVDGSRHQRFIVRLASGLTLLFAHNIDIAPRLAMLAPGDVVAFSGVYEWNPEGGVVHWTHRDPSGQHAAGWLKHNGVTSH